MKLDTKTDKHLTFSQYARQFNVNRRTIYNWIENNESNIKIVTVGKRRYIKVHTSEIEVNNTLSVELNEEAIKDLSVSDLASLCTMYKLTPSHDSFHKLTMVSTELDKRLTNIFI